MRNQTPLAPGEPAFDVTVHIVRNDFGHLGRAYIETDEAEADEATIMSGQYSRPLRVVVFYTAEGWAGDEDIACAVLDRAGREHSPIGQAAQEFLERALGVDETLGD